ncbi:MAG: hypothetical protein ACXVPK_05750, partial [Tumebacillaceae bacterium]
MTERVTVDAIDHAGVVAGQFLDGTVELAFVYVIVELDKAYQPQYDYTNAHEYVSFQAEDFLHALARYGGGKEPEEFYVIQAKRTHELRLDEVNLLRKIREAVVLTEETILQKVIAPGRFESYLLGNERTKVRGFVSRWQDVACLRSSDEIVEHLGLKYYPGDFWE